MSIERCLALAGQSDKKAGGFRGGKRSQANGARSVGKRACGLQVASYEGVQLRSCVCGGRWFDRPELIDLGVERRSKVASGPEHRALGSSPTRCVELGRYR